MRDLVEHSLNRIREREFSQFVALLKRERVESYLEIGSEYGDSLLTVSQALPFGARIVSVDIGSKKARLKGTIHGLKALGFDAWWIRGDSTDDGVVEQVRLLGPYDCAFIDANHTLSYVTKDWLSYGPMARMVAFHDISFERNRPTRLKKPVEVMKLWDSIKGGFRYEEIKLCQRNNGIGVLWR